MRCDYCGLALPVDEPGSMHEMCATEVRTDSLIDTIRRHCDLPCCNPEEEQS